MKARYVLLTSLFFLVSCNAKPSINDFSIKIDNINITYEGESITTVKKATNLNTLQDLSDFMDYVVFTSKNDEVVYTSITDSFKEKLKEDILLKISKIENLVSDLNSLADNVPKNYKVKLEERLKELSGSMEIDESRIATEICLFADKSTIDEEIIRLNSHIQQVRQTLELREPVGRKLDFIIQEMNRETNTIGSKSGDMEMTNIVIDIKNILEKIREQVQNIE